MDLGYLMVAVTLRKAMSRFCSRVKVDVLGSYIDALSWEDALHRIEEWARLSESHYVCACNVHSIVSATLDDEFKSAINAADMNVPDGMPVAWSLRRFGFSAQQRIDGPELMWRLCENAATVGKRVFFYGSSAGVLARLNTRLTTLIPTLQIAGMHAPPYRLLTKEEDEAVVELINASGAELVFVGMGCPKQEIWMAQHRGKLRGVMIGVGAAFDYHAGTLSRAPYWMQRRGLEWLYRLLKEPKRLWRRYLITNSVFVYLIARRLYRPHKSSSLQYPVGRTDEHHL
jgi:N-acetylglucosaminyldiphosphoundecaprenol N-acetyl-beta-D-mannosaminyltransferase